MSAVEAIRVAEASGIRFGVEGADLVLEADLEPPEEVVNTIRHYKAEIIALLACSDHHGQPADRQSGFKDHTPVQSIVRTLPHSWAEGLSRLMVMPSPGKVPTLVWNRFVKNSVAFANSWASQAAALEWQAKEIWGCDAEKPYERIDHAGLVWFLDGNEVMVLTRDTALIKTASGATQTYRVKGRTRQSPDIVMAWDLGV